MLRQDAVRVVVTVLVLIAGGAAAGDGPIPDGLAGALPKSVAIKAAPLYPALDSRLNQVLTSDSPLERARELGFKTRAGQVQVVLMAAEGMAQEVTDWLIDSGATGVMSARNLIEAYVAPDFLKSINADDRVLSVRRPSYYLPGPQPGRSLAQKAGTYLTEGIAAMNAGAWHSAGFTGNGIKVAVIDVGFEGYTALLGSDLPPANRVFYSDFSGAGMENEAHGTACAEIVHDIVPNADEFHLYVALSDVEVAQAINTARTQGINVVSISLGALVWGPGDGTGVIADALDSFTAAGGLAAVSAGNFRVGHWQGAWNDPDANNYLNFTSDVEVNYLTTDGDSIFEFPADEDISVQLVWNQWSAPTTDLDLFLYRWNEGTEQWDQVAASEDAQSGGAGQLPIEFIAHTTTQAGYYGAVVKHYGGPKSVDIELVVRPETLPLRASVANGSVTVPGDTGSAFSVAALDTSAPYALEYYSSRGPTNGPGGRLTGGSIKPDISGYANVSTTAYGARGFNGTSAACPHVAGAAALLWSAHPNWSNTQVRSFLENNAADKGPAGKDNDYGFGRLTLGAPPSSCSYSISPTSRSHAASGGTGTVTVSSSSGCSWNATSSRSWITITGGASGSGNGTVSYSVAANSSSSSRSGTMTIAGKTFTVNQSGSGSTPPPSGDFTYYAVIAHTTGASNSIWQSSLSVLNISSASVSATVTYRYGSNNRVVRNVTIPGYALKEWMDAAVDLFGVGGKSSGVIQIEADRRLLVSVRTFNSSTAGTFGQALPGVASSDSITSSEVGIISPVRRNTRFRTNIGVINTSSTPCTVNIYFGDDEGWLIGDTISLSLGAGAWKQVNEALKEAGINRVDSAYALIELVTPGAKVWAYGTVIDNSSGDPTALQMVVVD